MEKRSRIVLTFVVLLVVFLSDQKIVDLLQKRGIKIARRTVAKYRKGLHILPSNLRRSQ